MKKLITVCQILVVLAVISVAYGGDVIKGNFSEITLNGGKVTSWDNVSDNASRLVSGTVAKTRGGFGADVSAQTGIPTFNTGYISWKTFTQFLAFIGVTFNPADNTWHFLASSRFTGNVVFDNEITVKQVNTTCSYADNGCGINASNAGRPLNPVAGDCFYDNTVKKFECFNGSDWDNLVKE